MPRTATKPGLVCTILGMFLTSTATASNEIQVTLALDPESIPVGGAVTASASVLGDNGPATGHIVIDDGETECTIVLPDTACTLTPASRGHRSFSAYYLGDANYQPAVSEPRQLLVTAAQFPQLLSLGDGKHPPYQALQRAAKDIELRLSSISDNGRFLLYTNGQANGLRELVLADMQDTERPRHFKIGLTPQDRQLASLQAGDVSDDGRYVAFAVGDDVGSSLYVWDANMQIAWRLLQITRGSFFNPQISPDGRFVATMTTAPLDPRDTNSRHDVYLFDRENNSRTLASRWPGSQASAATNDYRLLPNGTVVFKAGSWIGAYHPQGDRVRHVYRTQASPGFGGIGVSMDRKKLVFADLTDTLSWVDMNQGVTRTFRKTLVDHQCLVRNIALSADGQKIAAAWSCERLDGSDTVRDIHVFNASDADIGEPVNLDNTHRSEMVMDAAGANIALIDGSTVTQFETGPGSSYPVKIGPLGNQSNEDSYALAVSDNARYTVFASIGNLLEGIQGPAVYVRDRTLHETHFVIHFAAAYPWRRPSVIANGPSNFSVSNTGTVVYGLLAKDSVCDASIDSLQVIEQLDIDTGQRQCISDGADGPANGGSNAPAIDTEGTMVAFYSLANNLVENDNNASCDVFVKNLLNGDINIISTASDGSPGYGTSGCGVDLDINSDGSLVVFTSRLDGLSDDDFDDFEGTFIKHLDSGQTDYLDLMARPPLTISNNGRFLLSGDLVTDRNRGLTRQLEPPSDLFFRPFVCGPMSDISKDGRFVAMQWQRQSGIVPDPPRAYLYDLDTPWPALPIETGAADIFFAGKGKRMAVTNRYTDLNDRNQSSDVYLVNNPRLAPAAVDDAYSATFGSTIVVGAEFGVLVNDTHPLGDTIRTFGAAVEQTDHGAQLDLEADGSFSFTPGDGQTAASVFKYQITDGALRATAYVTITIVQPF